MNELHVIDHPLITHKLSIMRDKNTGSKDFRELLNEIAMLMGYELTRDLPLEEVEIETPLTKMKAKTISGKKLAVIPILRAGLGMVDGLLSLIPVPRLGTSGFTGIPIRMSRSNITVSCRLTLRNAFASWLTLCWLLAGHPATLCGFLRRRAAVTSV